MKSVGDATFPSSTLALATVVHFVGANFTFMVECAFTYMGLTLRDTPVLRKFKKREQRASG